MNAVDGFATSGTFAYGRFHTRDANNRLVAIPWKPIDDATAFGGGGASWAPVQQYGIWAKSHYVIPPYRHAAIRIIPRNQKKWLSTPNPWHVYFAAPKVKRYGDLAFATIGGGPSHESTPVHTWGYLQSRFNSETDINKNTVDRAERLWNYSYEDATITELFNLADAFDNQTLFYEPVPSSLSDGYNSNSYLRGLLTAAGLPMPTFTTDSEGNTLFPGWMKPVPVNYFLVQP